MSVVSGPLSVAAHGFGEHNKEAGPSLSPGERVARGASQVRGSFVVLGVQLTPQPSGGVKKSPCHAERSEASAFISLKTHKCRFLAPLGMTGLGDFFTPSRAWVAND